MANCKIRRAPGHRHVRSWVPVPSSWFLVLQFIGLQTCSPIRTPLDVLWRGSWRSNYLGSTRAILLLSLPTTDHEIDSDLMFVLLLLLAVILPPACVYMIKGKDSFPFKLNLVSWLIGLLGWGLFRFLTIKFIWLAYAFALVHAIFVLLGQT